MRNKEIAVINLSAILISGITGTIMAFNGFSYWSLVWQQLIYNIVTNIGRYIFARWRPSLKIDFGPVKEMFGFCSKLLITNILNTLNQHLLTFVFGRLFPIHSVGNYTQASKWSNMAHSTVSNTLWQVVQPVFVAVNDDRERELRVFRKLLRFTAFLSFPIMLGLALVSREFILVTIGERWLGCVMLMRIICIGGAFMPFYVLFQNLSISKGRSDLYMWCNICQIVAQLAIILLLSNQNIEIIVGASAAFTILWLLVWQNIGHRLIGLSLWELLKDLIPFLVVALAVMAATYFLTASITQPIVLLLARVAIAAVLYVGAMRLLHAKVMEECIRFILRKNKTL
jgi:O-antigen/teichoic acid export membrane protein